MLAPVPYMSWANSTLVMGGISICLNLDPEGGLDGLAPVGGETLAAEFLVGAGRDT